VVRLQRWFGSTLAVAVFQAGCASIGFNASYESNVKHEALPLRSTVTVLLSSQLRKDKEDEAEKLESVRSSLSEALKADLSQNGPITPVAQDPEARLEVTLKTFEYKETKLWIMMWMLAPLWLFAVPMNSVSTELAADIRLLSSRGDVLFETTRSSKCTRLEGIYYGHDALTFGCTAREISEALRESVSLNRSEILGRIERTRPAQIVQQRPQATPPRPSSSSVALVFPIRDMSDRFDKKIIDQLSELLNAQLVMNLGFRIVPKDLLRGQLADAKAESFKACYDQSCQIELGKAVAANKTVSVSLISVGARCVFNATVFDLRTEAAEKAASADTACNDDALIDGIRSVVQKLGP
jgi:hypothetical protein